VTVTRPPTIPDLPTQYAPAEVEASLYERWVERGYFTADANGDGPRYAMVIPPPNVTGSLHIGHALGHTLMDALIRRKRMQGYDTLWLPGMDHAGISTQTLVERHLAETEGKSKHDYARADFVAKVWEWKEEYGGKILGQMRRLGDSVDWTRERFTMDEGLSVAVRTIFKKLYDDDLIYRAERIINWCPRCLTALSDIEVDHSEDDGELISIRYGDGDESVVVATTRAETMLGDTAVAVHPDDPRYKAMIGKQVKHLLHRIGELSGKDLHEFFTSIDISRGIKDGFFLQPRLEALGMFVIHTIARKCFLLPRPKEEMSWFIKIASPQLNPLWVAPTFATGLFEQGIRDIIKAETFPEGCSPKG